MESTPSRKDIRQDALYNNNFLTPLNWIDKKYQLLLIRKSIHFIDKTTNPSKMFKWNYKRVYIQIQNGYSFKQKSHIVMGVSGAHAMSMTNGKVANFWNQLPGHLEMLVQKSICAKFGRHKNNV